MFKLQFIFTSFIQSDYRIDKLYFLESLFFSLLKVRLSYSFILIIIMICDIWFTTSTKLLVNNSIDNRMVNNIVDKELSERLVIRSSSIMYDNLQSSSVASPITFNVNENTPIGTIIGYIPELIYPTPLASIKFTLPHNIFFEIDYKGALRVIGELDRDDNPYLCLEPGYPQHCIWSSFAITTDGQYIGLRITVNDLNDNIPKWPQSFILINVQEEIKTTQTFELPLASDPDYGINSIQEYRLKTDKMESKYFKLLVEKHSMENLSLYNFHLVLNVIESLDRERQSWYNLSLLAIDGNKPYHTGTLKITVHITDENDHTPTFSSKMYQAVISEDLEIGSVIYLTENNQTFNSVDPLGILSDDSSSKLRTKNQLHATDPDEGLNGEIEYHYAASTPNSVLENFELDKNTGLLYIARTLNYDIGPNEWNFQVIASDKGRPPRSSTTTVQISLSDANTHAPTIKPRIQLSENYKQHLSRLNISITSNNHNILHIPENVPHTNDALVVLTVSDQDTGLGGSFECNLKPNDMNTFVKSSILSDISSYPDHKDHITIQSVTEQFYLNFTGKLPRWKIYSIYATTTFDRELEPTHLLHIVCIDEGTPKMTSTYTLTVIIEDENDNAPEFTENQYEIHVMEENQPNSTVGRIVAIDKDANQNGKVNYKIQWPNQYKQYNNLFILTEHGKLIATQSLDRERVPNGYKFTVVAFDSGIPSLSTSTNVHIILDDINDCIPNFSQSEYNFTIVEDFMQNYTGPRIIGMVVATDCDIGLNSMLIYSLLDPGLPFEIDSHGLLKTNRIIDRESQSIYQFTVLATDGGVQLENRYLPVNYQIDDYEEEIYEVSKHKITTQNKNNIHTSAVTVRILVSDLNDNTPIFVYPNTSVFKVRLSVHEKKGFIVTRLVAVDKDSGRNGEIHYSLLKGDPKHIFGLRHDTGEIIVTNTIQKSEDVPTILSIQASDRGVPPKSSKIDIQIIITDSPPIGRSLGTLDEYQLANLKSLGLIGITEVDNTGAVELNKLIMMCIVVSTAILCIILIITIGVFAKRTTCKNIFNSIKQRQSVKMRKTRGKSNVPDVICKDNDDDINQQDELQEEMKNLKEKNSIEFCDVLSHVQYNHYQEMAQKSSLIPKTPNTLANAIKLDHLLQFVKDNNSNNNNIVTGDSDLYNNNNTNEDTFSKSTLTNLHCDNICSPDISISLPSYTKNNFTNDTLFMGHLECNRLITTESGQETHSESLPTSVINSVPYISYAQDAVMTLPRVCAIHGAPGTAMKLLALPLNDSSYLGCSEMNRNLCTSSLNDAPVIDSDVDSGRGGSVNNIGSSPNSDQITLNHNVSSRKPNATVFPVHYVTGSLNFSLIPVSVATSLNLTPSTSSNPPVLLPLSEIPNVSTESTLLNPKKYSKLTGDKLKVTFAENPNEEEISSQLTNSLDGTKPIIHYPTVSPDPVKKDKGPWRLIQCTSNNVKL
ncbi:unnamed protein product [Schistosoma bovis]|nr:unnamed protein product [Schistosoma bovis]